MSFEKIKHDPDSTVDYLIQWDDELTAEGADVIVTADAIIPDGLTLVDQSNTATAHTIWISGGTTNTDYTVTSRITTAGGRTEDQSITLQCREL